MERRVMRLWCAVILMVALLGNMIPAAALEAIAAGDSGTFQAIRTQRAEALAAHLLVDYDFSNVENGVVRDLSGNEYHGSIQGNVTVTAGMAYFEDGYIQMPDLNIGSLEGITATGWLNRSSITNWTRIFDLGTNAADDYINLAFDGSNEGRTLISEIRPDGNLQVMKDDYSVPIGEWLHFAVTFGENQSALYVNGEKVGELPGDGRGPSVLGTVTRGYIARSHYNDPYFKGYISNFQIYDKVLDDAEITEVKTTQDNRAMQELVSALNEISLGSLLDVRDNLNLPDSSGDIPFTWSSSRPELISNTGAVTPLASGTREQVVLRVTAEKNGVCANREFTATLLYREPDAVLPQDSLLAAYDFGTSFGTIIPDVSGNGQDASIEGEVELVGGVALLDGGAVKLPEFSFQGTTAVTVTSWVNREQMGNNARLFDIGVENRYFNMMFNSQRRATVEIRPYTSGSTMQTINVDVPEYGEWVHVSVVIGNGISAVYINGRLTAENRESTYTPDLFTSTGNSYIGKSQYAGSPFYDPNLRGMIDNFKIYGRALTPAQIDAVMQEENESGIQAEDLRIIKTAIANIQIQGLEDVTGDLSLPASNGEVQFEWNSSKPEVIGRDGRLTISENRVEHIILTVTASYRGLQLNKDFEAYVYRDVEEESIHPKYLLASYRFNEKIRENKVLDDSGKGNHALVNGKFDISNGLAIFDGGYLQLPNNITSQDALTVSGWIRVEDLKQNARFFDFGSGTNSYYNFILRSNNGTSDVEIKPNGVFHSVRAGNYEQYTQNDGWVHVVSTYAYENCVLYLNGQQAASASIASKPRDLGATHQNYLGKSQFSDPMFKGLMEEVNIYSIALTQEQVTELYAKENQTANGEVLQKVYSALQKLTLKGLEDVSKDITLPKRDGEIIYTWSSDQPDVVTHEGKVTPPSQGEQIVKLTATAQIDGSDITYSREFTVTVKHHSNQEIVEYDAEHLGLVKLIDVEKVSLPTQGKWGSAITWESSDENIVSTDGTVWRPAPGEGTVTVDLKATIRCGDAVVVKEFNNRKVMEEYTAYLLTYFGGKELIDGRNEAGYATVHFAYSYDGLHWMPLNNNETIVAASLKGRDNPAYGQDRPDESLARDPVVFREQDGKLRLISSHSWNNHDIYVWDSGDLTSFTGERILSVNTDKGNAWAPEAVYDPVKEKYMIIFTDPGMQERGSCGFGTYTDDWTQENVNSYINQGMTNIPLMDMSADSIRYIDVSMHYYNGTYYMPFRYWTNAEPLNGVAVAKSDSLEAKSFTAMGTESVGDGNNEGPFIIKDLNQERFYLYYDYPDSAGVGGSGTEAGKFGCSYTDDLDSNVWHRVPADEYAMPAGVRHGNAISITQGELDKLITKWGASAETDIAQLSKCEKNVASGTSFKDLNLPEMVEVILLDGSRTEMPVEWDESNYKAEEGRYKIYGTFKSKNGISNSKGFRPYYLVTVGGSENFGKIVDINFHEIDGKKALDTSGFGYHMTFQNPLQLAEGRKPEEQAARFDGSQTAAIDKELMMDLKDATFAFWLKLDQRDNWARVFDFGQGTFNFINFIPSDGDGYIRSEIRVFDSRRQITTNRVFPEGEWTHVALTMSPKTKTAILYLNGQEIGRSANYYYGPENLGMSQNIYIGKSAYSDPNLRGSLDLFQIYDRVLSKEQIEKLVSNQEPYEQMLLSDDSLNLEVGGGSLLKVINNYIPAYITWSSSNPAVATVEDGFVKGIAKGSAVIKASAPGMLDAICQVTVEENGTIIIPPIKVTGIKVKPSAQMLEAGKSIRLTAEVLPANAANRVVQWSSSNQGVASVDQNGLVNAKKAGEVVITAKTVDGGKTASCRLKVAAPVTSVRFAQSKLYLVKGKSVTVPVVAYTKDGSKAALTYSSSNKKVVSVTAKGKIKALKKGSAVITVKAENGKKRTLKVTVVTKRKAAVIKSIKITTVWKTLKKGEIKQLKTKITPSKAANAVVKWTSSKPGVASVDAAGRVTAKKKGKTVLTLKVGKKKAHLAIRVK